MADAESVRERIELEFTALPPAELDPQPYNPRTMSEEERANLYRGLDQYGLVEPLVVRAEDQGLIGGHQRREWAMERGESEVPVALVSGLTEAEAKALNVLLNNPDAQGSWDMGKLPELLMEITEAGLGAGATGFTEDAIRGMLSWAEPGRDGDMPSDEEWERALGDPDMPPNEKERSQITFHLTPEDMELVTQVLDEVAEDRSEALVHLCQQYAEAEEL